MKHVRKYLVTAIQLFALMVTSNVVINTVFGQPKQFSGRDLLVFAVIAAFGAIAYVQSLAERRKLSLSVVPSADRER